MTTLLQKAFDKCSQFKEEQQNIIAKVLLEIDEIHPDFGPMISCGEELFEQLEVTQEDVETDRQELAVE